MGDHPEDRTIQLLESIANGKQQLTQFLTQFFPATKQTKTREVPMGTMQRPTIEVVGLLKGVIPMCPTQECLPGR
jgi:hypothetical protein